MDTHPPREEAQPLVAHIGLRQWSRSVTRYQIVCGILDVLVGLLVCVIWSTTRDGVASPPHPTDTASFKAILGTPSIAGVAVRHHSSTRPQGKIPLPRPPTISTTNVGAHAGIHAGIHAGNSARIATRGAASVEIHQNVAENADVGANSKGTAETPALGLMAAVGIAMAWIFHALFHYLWMRPQAQRLAMYNIADLRPHGARANEAKKRSRRLGPEREADPEKWMEKMYDSGFNNAPPTRKADSIFGPEIDQFFEEKEEKPQSTSNPPSPQIFAPGEGLSLSGRQALSGALKFEALEDEEVADVQIPLSQSAILLAEARAKARNPELYQEEAPEKLRQGRLERAKSKKSWDRARKFSVVKPLTDEEARAEAEASYAALKSDVLVTTVGLSMIFAAGAYVGYGADASISVGFGAVGSILYQRLLASKIDGNMASPTLLIPGVLLFAASRFEAVNGPERFGFHLELIPMLAGFFTYKASFLGQIVRELAPKKADRPKPMAMQMLDEKETEKQEVKGYFETTGFDRWNRIYSESDDVNNVQRNIRIGHQKTVDEVLAWIRESGEVSDVSFCDAGCGVGSLSLPLAAMGAGSIEASDISEEMAKEADRRAQEVGLDMSKLNFIASDLESLKGSFHTVCCLDVFIHYPQPAAEEMVKHLCGLTEERLIVSFAPYTPLLALLKGIGQLFPGPSKTTRAYTLKEDGIVKAAESCGFKQVRRTLNQAPFYYSALIEFRKT